MDSKERERERERDRDVRESVGGERKYRGESTEFCLSVFIVSECRRSHNKLNSVVYTFKSTSGYKFHTQRLKSPCTLQSYFCGRRCGSDTPKKSTKQAI